ncbi:iron-containing alcohol dehydrogenase [Microbacterium sp. Root61]|uniref:iron-containing alcohol dehydrogenase n=1 Tax=Microbacterium sp. Root61 TaxID=1736570 RepID=UPI0009E784FF|nr:iron-containing alcohol dehydrogenase [Microbacterium sp. Root61]
MSASSGILRLPRDVRYGYGVSAAVAELAAGYGSRVVFVADPFLATTPEFDRILQSTRATGAEVLVLTDVPPELPVSAVLRAGEAARTFAPDVVVGYGGGSALDQAKLVALLISYPPPLETYYGENAVPGPVTPLIAVPTTAGTGSEVTPVAVVSDPARAMKVGISSPHLIPSVAIVDPALTLGAPVGVTTYAGIDALVHAVESYTAAELELTHTAVMPVFIGRNELTESLSLEAAALIFHALPTAVHSPDDRDARAAMSRGSLLAGMAFGAAGTHLSHAIQYPVGAITHTPHGLGTGMLLPFVLQACLIAVPERLARLGAALGLPADGSVLQRAQATVDAIDDLTARIGLPRSLAELGIGQADRDSIVDLALQSSRLIGIAPIHADRVMIASIVDAAIAGNRSLLRASATDRQEHP